MSNHPSTAKSAYNLRNQRDNKNKRKITAKPVKMASTSSVIPPSHEAAEMRSTSDLASTFDLSDDSETPSSADTGSELVLSCMADMKNMLSGKLDNVLSSELTAIKSDLAQTKKSLREGLYEDQACWI